MKTVFLQDYHKLFYLHLTKLQFFIHHFFSPNILFTKYSPHRFMQFTCNQQLCALQFEMNPQYFLF